MDVFQAIILGVVQGLTEFLPVSSSGHLALMQSLFHIEEPTQTFDIVLHIGTLIPVCIIFRRRIIELVKKPLQAEVLSIIIGTIPAVLAALFLSDVVDGFFTSITFLPVCFLITALFLVVSDHVRTGRKKEVGFLDAFVIGVFQAFAIPPGISRSGSTITGSLLRGLDRGKAAEFSFLLSIPAILGAAVLQIKDVTAADINVLNFAAGFIASALSGYLAISFMLNLIKKAKLSWFAVYMVAIAIFTFVWNVI